MLNFHINTCAAKIHKSSGSGLKFTCAEIYYFLPLGRRFSKYQVVKVSPGGSFASFAADGRGHVCGQPWTCPQTGLWKGPWTAMEGAADISADMSKASPRHVQGPVQG